MRSEKLFYGKKDQEVLDVDAGDTIRNIVDSVNASSLEEAISFINFPIEVHEFKPMDVEIDPDWILDTVLETLDAEYADPDGDDTSPTENMKIAAQEFVEKIRNEYSPYVCEPTGEILKYSKEEVLKFFKMDELVDISKELKSSEEMKIKKEEEISALVKM